MGVWDRDYTQEGYEPSGRWGLYMPPRGALVLIVLHVLGALLVQIVRHDERIAAGPLFELQGSTAHPAAIVLHPIGAPSLFTLIFVVYVLWTLGSRIEARFSVGRMVTMYVLGNLIAGVVYFGFAGLAPELGAYPLGLPVGGFAAWVLAAWRAFKHDATSIFGKLTTVANVVAIGAAIVAALTFFRGGPAATGWLIAAAAGATACPMVRLIADGLVNPAWTRRSESGRRRRLTRAETPRRHVSENADVDAILEKISREGIDALTEDEQERLEAARRQAARRSR